MVLPTTQFKTEAVVFDSNLPFSKTEKSYDLPQKVRSYNSYILFCKLKNNESYEWVVRAKRISKYGRKYALAA